MANTQAYSLLLLLVLLPFALSAKERCHPDDKRALVSIKKHFNNAELFASWDPKTDCCDWYVAKCDPNTNRINSLAVTNDNDLAGPIPDAVGDLPHLLNLIFTNLPRVTGPIPGSISRLKSLNFLWISHTNVTGPIPDFVGQLINLTYINLSVNKLTGPIPPSLSNLHQLGALFLDRNGLTGSIPASFGGFKSNVDFYLKLAKNSLSGPVPRSLGAVNFTVLDISRNYKLTGDASFLFGVNKGLQTADLSRNQLSFDMTNLRLPKSLNTLDLSHNLIYGSLSKGLTKLSMQEFNVSYNRLCGRIPTGGEMSRYDKYSYVHNKCLCGSPLPPCK